MDGYGVVTVSKDSQDGIAVSFPYDPKLVAKVKTIEGRKWHKEEKYWSFLNTDETLKKILKAFEDEEIHLDPVLKINIPTHAIAKHPEQSEETPKQSQNERLVQTFSAHDFDDFRRELVSRKYSYKTVKSYVYYNKDFLTFANKQPSKINDNDIKDYLLYLAEEREYNGPQNLDRVLSYTWEQN